MDIQNSVFQANSALGHQRIEMGANGTKDLNQSKDEEISAKSGSIGNHSLEVIDRLTNKLKSQSVVNSEKVERLKAQIAEGTFEINTQKIADSFLWGERIATLAE